MSAVSGLRLKPSDSASVYIKDGWFSEVEAMWPGQKMSLQVEEVLVNGKSDFQDILVFKSTTYGTVLVLDGVIQLTERDEFAYQEMIAHIPLYAHSNPKKVLIVGGGDGGVLREVSRHPGIETIHMCEIDPQVVEVGKAYFGTTTAVAYNDPRLTLIFDDAARYLREEGKSQGYDVIICDSSDPVGPAETLFCSEFFQSMNDALSPSGILCTQGECQWLHQELIARVITSTRTMLPSVRYAYTTIPTYPCGQIGFIVASKDASVDPAVPAREVSPESAATLKYYSSAIHKAAFILPAFTAQALGQSLTL